MQFLRHHVSQSVLRSGIARVGIVVALVLLAFEAGQATEHLSTDGAWWQGLSAYDRVTAVVGLAEGYTEGYSAGYAKGVTTLTNTLSTQSRGAILVDGRYLKVLSSGNVAMSKAYGSYVDELTDFYTNYPALSDIPAGRILQCMVDHPDHSCDDLAEVTLKARGAAPH
jgi:hypothetical protein